MKKFKNFIVSLFLTTGFISNLSSCFFVVEPLTFNIVTPSGAMMVPFAHWYSDTTHLKTMYNTYATSSNDGIAELNMLGDAFFTTDSSQTRYDMIVYDVYQGLDYILNYDLPFKLARVINTGNMFLLETKHYNKKYSDTDSAGLTNNSKVVYYADTSTDANATTNYDYAIREYIKKAYPMISEDNLYRVEDVTIAYHILLSEDGSTTSSSSTQSLKNVDFVFIENPRAFEAIKSSYNEEEDKYYVKYHNEGDTSSGLYYSDVNSSIKKQISSLEISNLYGYPDKGLFIRDYLEEDEYNKVMKNFFDAYDIQTSSMEIADYHTVDKMMLFGEVDEQNMRIGTNYYDVKEIQAGTLSPITNEKEYNLMSFISPNSSTYNNTYIDLQKAFDYFLPHNNFSDKLDDALSKYYIKPKTK